MTKVEKEKAAGKGESGVPRRQWSNRLSINGKKIGRTRTYDNWEGKEELRREKDKLAKRKKRKEERERRLREQKLSEDENMTDKKDEEAKSEDNNKRGEEREDGNEEGENDGDCLNIVDLEYGEKSNEEVGNNGGNPGFDNEAIDVDTDDPETIRRNNELDMRRAEIGEFEFEKIKQFGTIVDVAYDGNCGFLSFIGALKYVKRKCREDVGEFRRDIRNYIENHKSKDMFEIVGNNDLDAIFKEGVDYTGVVGRNRWMEGSIVGIAVANLFNVVVYIYSEDTSPSDKKRKKGKGKKHGDEVGEESVEDDGGNGFQRRTTVYRPFEHSEYKKGFISMMKKDSHRASEVVRLYNQIEFHYQWIMWGAEVKMEGVDEEAAVHDAIDVEDDEGARGEEAKQDDVREAARGMLAMGRTGGEETVRFVDGIAYHPRYVGRQFYEQIHAMDRPMDRNPTAESEMYYPAKLVCVFF